MSDQKGNEIVKSGLKTLFSLIKYPIIAAALNELIDYRSKIKQNRLNQFTELLENYFSNHQGVNLENFQTVEFSDLFEAVVIRVVQNKSTEKLNLYKNVLVNQLTNTEFNIDHSEIFLDLIATLNLIEIKILKEHQEFKNLFNATYGELEESEKLLEKNEKALHWITKEQTFGHEGEDVKYINVINELKRHIGFQKENVEGLKKIKLHDHYGISESDFLFYKQRLLSKGLLTDVGVGAIGNVPFMNMGITEFGNQFLLYIFNS